MRAPIVKADTLPQGTVLVGNNWGDSPNATIRRALCPIREIRGRALLAHLIISSCNGTYKPEFKPLFVADEYDFCVTL